MKPISIPERVSAIEQKENSDDERCDARHNSVDTRVAKLETALWGENRDGDGGIVNKLNSTIMKVALLTGLTSFAGSAVGMLIIQHLARKAATGGN